MINFNTILKTDKILLRPIEEKDFEEIKELTHDTEMWTYFTSDLSAESELKAWIRQAVKENKNESRLAFVVIELNANKIIGSTSIGNISKTDQRVEIGWTWLAKEYQSRGYNSNVKKLLLQYCFETLALKRVEFKTDVLNIAARKALAKIGAIEEGMLRSHTLMVKNRRRDTMYYSVLNDEWNSIKRKNNWI